jgi:hypothetical protein
VVIHLAGPFPSRDYTVAERCIAQGAHYIDLADSTTFVTGITALNDAARAAGVFVLSGASSVPALSAAVVDALVAGCASVSRIDIGISPGNRTERGLATVRAILGYCGQPLPGAGDEVGWLGSWRHDYAAPVGNRLHSPCDVPDRLLFSERYSGHPVVRFGAGLEVEWLHRAMNAMAWMRQRGWVADWSRHAALLLRMSGWFAALGSDHGGMHVHIEGLDVHSQPVRARWELIAEDGDGPFVPTTAAAALVRKHLSSGLAFRGAAPCMGLLSLDDFATEWAPLRIRTERST